MPFERNPNFTGRKELLDDLEQRLGEQSDSTKKIAIFGLGGVGKTHLVLELAYRVREQCAVFWIPVSSFASLQTAYQEVAQRLRLPGCEKNGAHILELVQKYLSEESIGPWLLILDNADDLELWTSPLSPNTRLKRLIEFLPQSKKGSIIFTTRNRQVAVKLAQWNVVNVPELDETGAAQMLRACLINPEPMNTEGRIRPALLQKLTYLPLAIAQAAAYVNETGISLLEYEDLWSEPENDIFKLQSQEFEDEGSAIATTWLISFEQIRHRSPLAADYLCFMACVDAKDIPETLLPQAVSRVDHTSAIGVLDAYSFIQKHSDSSAFDMHRLVHLATRGWLKGEESLPGWQGKAVLRLGELLANSDHTNRAQWRGYISHAQFAILDHTEGEDEMIDLARKCGDCLNKDGRYREAEAMYRIVVRNREKVLGPEHPDTLSSIINLGSVLSGQGQYQEAEAMHRRAFEGRERLLGLEHPKTLTSVSHVGSVLSSQGRYQEAEAMYRRAFEGYKKVLGPEHPDTLTSVSNLGSVLSSQGQYQEAEAMHRRAFEGFEKALGPKHPYTLTSVSYVGSVLSSQGQYQEAEAMHRQAFEAYENVVREQHRKFVE